MKTLSLRIPEPLFDEIERLAKQHGVDRSALGRMLLQRAVAENGRSVVEEVDVLREDILAVFETVILSFTDATEEQVRELVTRRLRPLDVN